MTGGMLTLPHQPCALAQRLTHLPDNSESCRPWPPALIGTRHRNGANAVTGQRALQRGPQNCLIELHFRVASGLENAALGQISAVKMPAVGLEPTSS